MKPYFVHHAHVSLLLIQLIDFSDKKKIQVENILSTENDDQRIVFYIKNNRKSAKLP